jgi:TRAP-type C4-dicarboxylate transport system substrate-binding protein
MDKMFVIVLTLVIIIGFSASAYIFSQINVSIGLGNITDDLTTKKAQVLEEINKCISQNSIAGGSITLNSFEKNLLTSVKEQINQAENGETLDRISEQIHTMTLCNPG